MTKLHSKWVLAKNEEKRKVYQRLRNLREDRDMSQTDLAKILHMSQTGYSKYETGENDIPTLILIHLAIYYNVSTDFLLGLTDVKQPAPRNKAYLAEYQKRLENAAQNEDQYIPKRTRKTAP